MFQIVNVCTGSAEPIRKAAGFSGDNPVVEYFNNPFYAEREIHPLFAA